MQPKFRRGSERCTRWTSGGAAIADRRDIHLRPAQALRQRANCRRVGSQQPELVGQDEHLVRRGRGPTCLLLARRPGGGIAVPQRQAGVIAAGCTVGRDAGRVEVQLGNGEALAGRRGGGRLPARAADRQRQINKGAGTEGTGLARLAGAHAERHRSAIRAAARNLAAAGDVDRVVTRGHRERRG